MKPPYEYGAVGHHVVDGDTVDVILDYGFSLKQKLRLRLSGINTPELNSEDGEERAKALEAKKFVQDALFHDGSEERLWRELIVKTIKTKAGKERQTFGRYVAEVYVLINGKWIFLNEALVEEGLAVRSSG